ncbi:MAG TPA: histidinol dehydrogenase [Longimicrobiales bacterium]
MTVELAIPVGTSVSALDDGQCARLFVRGRAQDAGVARSVAGLIEDVRLRGDVALRDQARRFDGVEGLTIEVPRARWRAALAALEPALRSALETAAANIATFHRAQLPPLIEIEPRPGLQLGRRADPLERVAVYAPGGRAAYPSSVLMGVVPARVAGVAEVIVCSPPGEDGLPPAIVLAACEIGGADRVFALGGAGAIAAVAFGTETVPRADKVVGPGNAYVTEAKRQLNGVVAIDCPAGPSEVLVLADESADAERVAFELLAQAEHDPDAASVLVSTSSELIERGAEVLYAALPLQPRREIIAAALRASGALLVAHDEREMIEFNRRYAPEHLALFVREPRALLADVRNAGTVFLGDASSVAFGDYLTGANHVLPTATLARSYSGLSTLDFVRWTTYQQLSSDVAAQFAPITGIFADAEGLPAHAAAARLRGGR